MFIFGQKKIWVWKNFGPKENFGSEKNSWLEKILDPKKILALKNILGPKKILGLKIFLVQLSKILVGSLWLFFFFLWHRSFGPLNPLTQPKAHD